MKLCQSLIDLLIRMVIPGRVSKPPGIIGHHPAHSDKAIVSKRKGAAMDHQKPRISPYPWHYILMIHVSWNYQHWRAKLCQGFGNRQRLLRTTAIMEISTEGDDVDIYF